MSDCSQLHFTSPYSPVHASEADSGLDWQYDMQLKVIISFLNHTCRLGRTGTVASDFNHLNATLLANHLRMALALCGEGQSASQSCYYPCMRNKYGIV